MPSSPFISVLHLPGNVLGRDFIAGDLSGVSALAATLSAGGFDPVRDRVFLVGDLLGTATDVGALVPWLEQPFVHAVCGAREMALLDLYDHGEPPPRTLTATVHALGLTGWLALAEAERDEMLTALCRLPVAIETYTSRGRVGLVHADVPAGMDWTTFCRRLQNNDDTALLAALWGRPRAEANDRSGVPGIDHLVVGHLPSHQLVRQGNVVWVGPGIVAPLFSRLPTPQRAPDSARNPMPAEGYAAVADVALFAMLAAGTLAATDPARVTSPVTPPRHRAPEPAGVV